MRGMTYIETERDDGGFSSIVTELCMRIHGAEKTKVLTRFPLQFPRTLCKALLS